MTFQTFTKPRSHRRGLIAAAAIAAAGLAVTAGTLIVTGNHGQTTEARPAVPIVTVHGEAGVLAERPAPTGTPIVTVHGKAGVLDDTDRAAVEQAVTLPYEETVPLRVDVKTPAPTETSAASETPAALSSSSAPVEGGVVTPDVATLDPATPAIASPEVAASSEASAEVGSPSYVEVINRCFIDGVLWASVPAVVGCGDTFNLPTAQVVAETEGGALLPSITVEVWLETYVNGALVSSEPAF